MGPPSEHSIMTLLRESSGHRSLLTIISLFILIGSSHQQSNPGGHHHHHSSHKAPADVKPSRQPIVQILIPNLPPDHYQYWLKNHPRAAKVFEAICQQVESRPVALSDLAEFQRLHHNLTFEDPQYINNLDYGKQVLDSICFKIRDVSKSCWGYENNCQDIYVMPECNLLGDAHLTKQEQDRKIAFFSQADFGYILDRVREFGKYCAPDKSISPTEVSSLECTKYFTTCRGQNLYIQFNTSTSANRRLSGKLLNQPTIMSNVGGWGCDLQKARIGEESGRDGWLESWYGELKGYDRVDGLEPMKICDYVEEKQVFFMKIGSASNLYDHLSSIINLYATIHLNNRFSEDNRIVIWDSNLPTSRTFAHLWAAFSRLPPMSIGQFYGKKVCFKKFIFVMPPKMIDGLDMDKSLVEGCSKSGLYNAFHKHIVHRLRIPNLVRHRNSSGKLNIVIMSRSETVFRNILNEQQLTQLIRNQSTVYDVEVIPYDSMDFGHVVAEVLNSDILIGVHGSGLAYSLFLPEWASLIELHDCGKERYHNLARLRGINYFKQEYVQGKSNLVKKIQVPEESKYWSDLKHRGRLEHDEYSNYEVDLDQFTQLLAKARARTLEARDDYFRKQKTVEHASASKTATQKSQVTPERVVQSTTPQPMTLESTTATPATSTTTSTTTTTTTTTTQTPSQQPKIALENSNPIESPHQEHNEL